MESSSDLSDAELQGSQVVSCGNCHISYIRGEKGSSEALSLCSECVELRKKAADPPQLQACSCGCGGDTLSSQHYYSDTGKRIFSF